MKTILEPWIGDTLLVHVNGAQAPFRGTLDAVTDEALSLKAPDGGYFVIRFEMIPLLIKPTKIQLAAANTPLSPSPGARGRET